MTAATQTRKRPFPPHNNQPLPPPPLFGSRTRLEPIDREKGLLFNAFNSCSIFFFSRYMFILFAY